MEQVTTLAALRGWLWVHFRPARTERSWRTPVSGPLGKGWPDLVLFREADRRLIFAELKRDGATTTRDQDWVIELLDWLSIDAPRTIQVHLWHPADWSKIEATLR